ncbi:MAG: type II toxin-antitoxin system VapB family antitoxin [Gammaproteobacteria bacterium]|nr:type II toxin-antitoxin system VapB family antitoxin [Gammaproteobacteria bacterium]
MAFLVGKDRAMEATAKLFTNGRSQAVRIPKALQFEGVSEVVLRREGDALLLVPVRKSWESFAEEAPPVDGDFMADRPDLMVARPVDL